MKLYSNNKGFTLVETLVAVAIFATAVTGLISITARGINDNVFVKNKLVASYLAQEGVELVRNMRDTSAIVVGGASYWTSFLTDVGDCVSDTCMIDGSTNVLVALPCNDDDTCPPLQYDSDNNIYGYNIGSEDSIFTRIITITPVPGSPFEILVTSSVSWIQGENTHTTSYQYNLFNWIY